MPPLLLSVFPTFAVGGAQTRFTTLANRLGAQWRHAIVAMDGVIAARERFDPVLDVRFPTIDIRKGDTIGNVMRFRAALRTIAPRTLLTHNFGSIEWAMANRPARVRHVHVEDGFGPDERDRQLLRRVWLRRIFLRGRTVALPSQTLMQIAREVWRLPPRDVHYAPNGIDLERFGAAPQPRPDRATGLVIGTVAALRPEKNVARLVRAFDLATRQLPGQLVIVGDGAERPALEQLVDRLAIRDRVSFTGHVPDPATLISSFDVFAMSSDTEQMPMSLLEAMAAGLPVAATRVGDIAAMLPEAQRSLLVPCDDTALAQALGTLLRDSALRVALGTANRARVATEFNENTMVRQWADLLQG